VGVFFFFKDTHSGRRKSTQEDATFFRRENIKKAGERKSFNKNPKKKNRNKKLSTTKDPNPSPKKIKIK